MRRTVLIALAAVLCLCLGDLAHGQTPSADFAACSACQAANPIWDPSTAYLASPPVFALDAQSVPQSGSGAAPTSTDASADPDNQGEQTKRILHIIPNFQAVSANAQLPPLSAKEKFWLATKNSFDYSGFIFAGILAGTSMAENSYPEFGEGAEAYGKYYWHTFSDLTVGNYFTEAIGASLTHEDPRFYTLESGGFSHRAGYAASRLFITRTDSGGRSFNYALIVGSGAAAGLGNLYYPVQERTLTKTAERFGWQLGFDGVFNMFIEFWPDIRQGLLRVGQM